VNGLHDMGGLHGFGPVAVEADEPVFHERWEARVFGIVQSLPGNNLDAGRHAIECLDPVTYLRHGYYGRWLAAVERTLAAFGVLTPGEVDARIARRRRRRASRARHPAAWTPPPARRYDRPVDRAPRFEVDQAVRTRDHQPPGHTRLPAYARRRTGTVVHVHPAMVYPDDHAHGRGENPQHVYTVRFDGRELWGEGAEPGTVVHLDLFEPYLEGA
jgi:nitrile hydratase